MHEPDFEPPVNPLPPVVIVLFLIIAGAEAVFSLAESGLVGGPAAIGWRQEWIQGYGFSGVIFDWMVTNGRWPAAEVARLVTFPFVHLGFTHSLFAMVLLLALGKLVGEVMGQWVVLALFFASGIVGAVVYAVVLDDPVWLVGAYPNVYGLIGGYSFIMWRKLGAQGGAQYQAFSLIAMLMALQLIWGLLFETSNLWLAELAGFFAGFGLCFLLAPGEGARIRKRMRRD